MREVLWGEGKRRVWNKNSILIIFVVNELVGWMTFSFCLFEYLFISFKSLVFSSSLKGWKAYLKTDYSDNATD